MIPAAYFFVDEKSDRYEKYASSKSKYFTIDEVFALDHKNNRALSNATNLMCHFIDFTYVFVIYKPDKDKMFLAKIGESNITKILIDTQEKVEKITSYYHILCGMYDFYVDCKSLAHFDLNLLFKHEKEGYEEDINLCNSSISKCLPNVEKLYNLCFKNFNKEFLL